MAKGTGELTSSLQPLEIKVKSVRRQHPDLDFFEQIALEDDKIDLPITTFKNANAKGHITNIVVPKGFQYLNYADGVFSRAHSPLQQPVSGAFLWPSSQALVHTDHKDGLQGTQYGCMEILVEHVTAFENAGEEPIFAVKYDQGDNGPRIGGQIVPANFFLLAIMPNAALTYVTFETEDELKGFLDKHSASMANGEWIDVGGPVWNDRIACILTAYDPIEDK